MTIDSSGNVGIGTETPGYKLDIAETAASPAFHLLNSNASDSFGLQICAGNDANDYAARIQDRTGTDLFKIQGDGNAIVKPPDGGGLKFYAGGTGHGNYIRWSDDSGSNNQGSFGYDHSTNDAVLYTAGNLNWTFNGDGNLDAHNGKFKSTADNQGFYTGASDDLCLYHDGTNNWLESGSGQIIIKSNGAVNTRGTSFSAYNGDTSEAMIDAAEGGAVKLFFDGSEKLRTVSGGTCICGALSKTSGSFRIEHPLESKKDTHQLVHSFIEGPQADLQYRGVAQLVDGSAQINIDTVSDMTDGTFVALNRCTQVFTTNESNWDAVRGSVTGNILTIESNTTDSTACISWMVVGERCDQHMMDTEWTHSDGRVIVEPEIE
jgi:hypothetical protein